MNIVGFVFARGGSKGVPRKNLRTIGGKSLIRRAIETGLGSRHLDRIFVSTDDPEIAREARDSGAEVPFLRPASLATDQVAEHLVWQHAIRTFNQAAALPRVDVLVSIPATVPLRVSQDIDCCIDAFLEGKSDVVITVAESNSNPFFNTVSVDADGYARRVAEPPRSCVRRQDAPPVFQIVPAAYVADSQFVLSSSRYFDGRVRAVSIPADRGVDIDSELDLEWAEFLCQRRSGNVSSEHRAA